MSDAGPPEACAACGFDSGIYNQADTISSQRVIGALLGAAAEGLDAAALGTRPDEGTWSIVEYVDHVREVVFGNRMAIEVARSQPGADLGEPPDVGLSAEQSNEQKPLDLTPTLEAVTREYREMGTLLKGLTDDHWRQSVLLGGVPHPVGWFARHVIHEGLHHLADIGRIRQRLGHGATVGSGTITGLHVSPGGVPKHPVDKVRITARGLEGDRQADRHHHGRPVQAVCLWSADVIAALQAEGHPVHAGVAGENITVEGVAWSTLRPGSRIDVGTVPLLITAHAIPCTKNAQWFRDRNFKRILHDRHPGSSRLYAIPLSSGTVSVGDPVAVEPPEPPA